ncbi:MAG TPA: hypothetical protein ENI52_04000 [Thermoplasmata archaeon]|nr:hypothetical protein [Thermoplasmata archaeon]
MAKKQSQKVKFIGGRGQIYHIGRKNFPYNVWKEVTSVELRHIIMTVKEKFDFNPPIIESKIIGKKRGKKKED